MPRKEFQVGRPYHGKARAVGYALIQRTHLVLELVCPEPAGPTGAGQPVVREASGEHERRTSFIVPRLDHGAASGVDDGGQQALRNAVDELIVRVGTHIALHRVHEYIHYAAGRLVRRERHSELRVHYCKERAVFLAAEPALDAECGVREHCAVACLAACGGYRQHDAHGQAVRRLRPVLGVIPGVKAAPDAVSGHFCSIYDAAAANGQQQLAAALTGIMPQLGTALRRRVGLYAAEFVVLHPRSIQRGLYALQQARPYNAAAAIAYEHAPVSARRDYFAHTGALAAAKVYFSRYTEFKIKHLSHLRKIISQNPPLVKNTPLAFGAVSCNNRVKYDQISIRRMRYGLHKRIQIQARHA